MRLNILRASQSVHQRGWVNSGQRPGSDWLCPEGIGSKTLDQFNPLYHMVPQALPGITPGMGLDYHQVWPKHPSPDDKRENKRNWVGELKSLAHVLHAEGLNPQNWIIS